MKYLVAIWAAPLVFFWGWYFLSLNDINFGYIMLTRQVHDLVFQIYGDMLGIDPATIPGLVAKACVFDTFFIVAIWAFRRRRQLVQAGRTLYRRHFGARSPAQEHEPVENALQDESGGSRINARFALLPGNVHLD